VTSSLNFTILLVQPLM